MKKRIIPIRLFRFIFLSGLLWTAGQAAVYGQFSPNKDYPAFNWGFRVGLNALSAVECNWHSRIADLTNGPYTNKSGCDVHSFFRINLDHFFMQPEVGWNLYQQEISFLSDNPGEKRTGISLKSYAVDMTLLAGYFIAGGETFSLGLICGPSFQYHYNTQFNTFSSKLELRDKKPHFIPYGVVGFAIGISRAYFDVRCGLNMIDTKIDFDKVSDKPVSLDNVSLRKNDVILNFSCGLIF
ncbi:MAG: hypothetical protein LBH61_04055 [Dysgonamonadaceae bacterium]|jgi:hypothetical protein|nr:hypothetical protein [Dysgonamonadaceae bacterium]